MSTDQEPEIVRARIRGYGCEYTPGVLNVNDDGHKWKNGILAGTLVIELWGVRGFKTIQHVPNLTAIKYEQGEEPTVSEMQELMAESMTTYPLLNELAIRKTTTYNELKDKNGIVYKKWAHVFLEVAPEHGTSTLTASLKELLDRAVPDNTEATLEQPESRIRPSGKKARKAALTTAAATQGETKT